MTRSDCGIEYVAPADIERRSMEIIESELGDTSRLSPAELLVVKRAIHATAAICNALLYQVYQRPAMKSQV